MEKLTKPSSPKLESFGLNEAQYSKIIKQKTRYKYITTLLVAIGDKIPDLIYYLIYGVFVLAAAAYYDDGEIIVWSFILILPITIALASVIAFVYKTIDLIENFFVNNINGYDKYLNFENEQKRYQLELSDYYTKKRLLEVKVKEERQKEKLLKEKLDKQKEFSYWFNLDPYEFEREIAELFIKHQFRAEPTKGSGDEGIDILSEYGDGYKGIAQCKRQKTKVSPSVIRDIYGTMMSGKFKYAFVICPAGFSDKSFEFAKGKKIILIGQKRLMQMVNDKPYSLDFLEV